jgi:hypothetical protein
VILVGYAYGAARKNGTMLSPAHASPRVVDGVSSSVDEIVALCFDSAIVAVAVALAAVA